MVDWQWELREEKKGFSTVFLVKQAGIIAIGCSWGQGNGLREGMSQKRPLSDIKVQLLLTSSFPAP